jgi:hypothetical protein
MDAVWNDRVALYCLNLVLRRGDSTIPADVPGYLRSQCNAARLSGRDELADALDQAADTYAQGDRGVAYAILLGAMVPPAAAQK